MKHSFHIAVKQDLPGAVKENFFFRLDTTE